MKHTVGYIHKDALLKPHEDPWGHKNSWWVSFSFLRLLLTVELNLDIDFEPGQTHFGVPIIEKPGDGLLISDEK